MNNDSGQVVWTASSNGLAQAVTVGTDGHVYVDGPRDIFDSARRAAFRGTTSRPPRLNPCRRIYSQAGLELTERARGELERFMTENARGGGSWSTTCDFGVDPAEVRKRFAFYFERFPVRAED